MKKGISVLMLILATAFCLTGCGKAKNLCCITMRNGFDFDLSEVYASAAGTDEKGDDLIETLATSDSQTIDLSEAAGAETGTIDLYVMVNDGDLVTFSDVDVSNGDVMNICYNDKNTPVLYINNLDQVDGEVTLSEEHQAEQDQALADAASDEYPNINDTLTQKVSFTGHSEVTIPYSDKMTPYERTDISNYISFSASNADLEQNPYVYYSNVAVALVPITGFDDAMNVGYAEAEKALEYITENAAKGIYGSKMTAIEIQSFKDNGNNWECEAVAVFDNTLWQDYSLDENILGFIDVKYVGATGYVIYSSVVACESNFETFLGVGCTMFDNMYVPVDYSTAAQTKTVTKEIKSSGKRSNGKPAYSGDTGDYGTPYYWTDADGDIWYWNGYEDIFYAYGDHYSIDDSGMVMENNDYGWGYDEYDEWSDYFNSTDEEGYEINDYGWGYDEYDEWSDPGDTEDYDYYDDSDDYDYYDDSDDYDYYDDSDDYSYDDSDDYYDDSDDYSYDDSYDDYSYDEDY